MICLVSLSLPRNFNPFCERKCTYFFTVHKLLYLKPLFMIACSALVHKYVSVILCPLNYDIFCLCSAWLARPKSSLYKPFSSIIEYIRCGVPNASYIRRLRNPFVCTPHLYVQNHFGLRMKKFFRLYLPITGRAQLSPLLL